jgi:hypothetical protein
LLEDSFREPVDEVTPNELWVTPDESLQDIVIGQLPELLLLVTCHASLEASLLETLFQSIETSAADEPDGAAGKPQLLGHHAIRCGRKAEEQHRDELSASSGERAHGIAKCLLTLDCV